MSDEYTVDKKLLAEAMKSFSEGGYITGHNGPYSPPQSPLTTRARSARIEKSAVLGYWVYPSKSGLGDPWWRLTRTGATKRARRYIDKGEEAWVIR